MLTCNINEITSKFEASIANTLLRHLAMKSLEAYANNNKLHKYSLLLYYPIDQLNTNVWSSANLIKKIKMFDVKPENVILSFSIKKYKQIPNQIKENLLDLELHGVNYFLVDVVHPSSLKSLTPQAIILDDSLTHKPKLIKQISSQNLVIL